MIAKSAILFAGLIVAAVLLNVYYLVLTFFTVFLFGIENELVLSVQYWICFVAGFATAFILLRKSWPKSPSQPEVALVDPED